jgi:hypothetical protein
MTDNRGAPLSRQRHLRLLDEARRRDEFSSKRLRRLVDDGVLAEKDRIALKPIMRRHSITRAARQSIPGEDTIWPDPRRPWTLVLPAALSCGTATAAVTWFGHGASIWLCVIAVFTCVAMGFVAYLPVVRFVVRSMSGPILVLDSKSVTIEVITSTGGLRTALYLLAAVEFVVPVVGLSLMGLYRWHGPWVVGVAAALLLDPVWTTVLTGTRAVRASRIRRLYLLRRRTLPTAHALAIYIFNDLDLAHVSRTTWRSNPRWIVAHLLSGTAFANRQPAGEWRPGQVTPDTQRRRTLELRNAAYLEWLRDRAVAFEDAVTESQYADVITAMRDDLRRCLAGDLGFLDRSPTAELRQAWWLRAAARIGPAVVLVAAAILLPHLPGVTSSGAALAGVQTGLAVAALLTLANASIEVQRTVGEAVKATSPHGGN